MMDRRHREDAVQLVLASGSPRRREFMHALGLRFEIHVADIDERNGEGESPDALVARLSCEKAQAVAVCYPDAAVIGADTIVTLDGQLLGKPSGPEDAAAMLRCLRDRPHDVYSGITVCPPGRLSHREALRHPAELDSAEARTTVVGSRVWMRPYGEDEIAAYVASGDPLDKAGAYAIQNAAFCPVARMRGCYASVMGLPLCALTRMLSEIGIEPPVPTTEACTSLTGVSCCGGEDVVFDLELGKATTDEHR